MYFYSQKSTFREYLFCLKSIKSFQNVSLMKMHISDEMVFDLNGEKKSVLCLRPSEVILTVLLTVGENIIATIKMRNNFCYPLKMFNIGLFSIAPHLVIALPTLLSLLISLLQLFYKFCRLVHGFFSVLLPI